MPTIDDANRAPPGHHWPVGSPQAEQLAREQRVRELAAYNRMQADYERRLTEATAPVAAEPQPDTAAASDENGEQ